MTDTSKYLFLCLPIPFPFLLSLSLSLPPSLYLSLSPSLSLSLYHIHTHRHTHRHTHPWSGVEAVMYCSVRELNIRAVGAGADWRRGEETSLPSLTRCFLSDRKSVINLQVGSGTLSCVSLSWRRAGAMVLYAER